MSTGTPKSNESFVAFISYSHKDAEWGRWVQRELERYQLPADFAKAHGLERKLGKVFRDREELPTGQNLGEHLTKALEASHNLVVICSPRSKDSPWVAKEIEYFKALGKGHRIFCLLVEGGAEGFPTPLLTDANGNPLEPLAADPRESGDGKRLAKLKLISGLVDTNLDQLARREYARRQRQLLSWSVVTLLILSITGGLAGAAYFFEQQRTAEVARNVETATRLSARIEEAYAYLDKTSLEINAQIISEYLDDIDDNELASDQRIAIASTLRTQGNAAYRLGRVEKALSDLERSRRLYQLHAKESPDDIDAAIEAAFADFYLASTHLYEGDYEAAVGPMNAYAREVARLFQLHPEHPVLTAESVYAPTAVLGLFNQQNDRFSEELDSATQTALMAANSAIDIGPNNLDVIDAYNAAMSHAADAYMKSCRVAETLPLRESTVIMARRALSIDPNNREYKEDLANALAALGDSLMNSVRVSEGIDTYLEALEIYEGLLATDPNNRYQKRQLLRTQIVLFAATVYHPDITLQIPRLDLLKDKVLDPTTQILVNELDLELPYLGRVADKALATHDWPRSLALNASFLREAELKYTGKELDRLRLVNEVRYRIVKYRTEQTSGEQLSNSLTAPTAHSPPTMPRDSNQRADESCAGRQSLWNQAILEGDLEEANRIASEMWRLGSRGTDLAFKSKMLGLPFPPLSEQ